MDRRIYGLETEYGITCTFRGHRRLTPDEVARYLFRDVMAWGRSSNAFLPNGGRLYLDVGSHPEYATPECDSLIEAVTHDRGGERIVERLAISAEERLEAESVRGDVFVFKNNTDSAGNSYGCHENYLTRRSDDLADMPQISYRSSSLDRSTLALEKYSARLEARSTRFLNEPITFGKGEFGHNTKPSDHQFAR